MVAPTSTTRCPDENQLLLFLRGSREAEEIRAIESHIDECEDCRALLVELVRHSWASPELSLDAEEAEVVESPQLVSSGGLLDGLLAPLLPEGCPFGRYTIVSRLGMGGMGVVYLAHDPELDRRVALKLVRPEADSSMHKARLQREAQAMARLSHPNIVTVYELGEFAGQLYIAMEYVEGQTLGQWLRGAKQRSQGEILARFVEAGTGLAFAHAKGIVHRDFKPDNVLLNAHQHAEVTDFGLARTASQEQSVAVVAQDGEETTGAESKLASGQAFASAQALSSGQLARTRTGAFVGTPAYMAPEQLRGEVADARSDQFAFCVALWEALTGSLPFAAKEIPARLAQIEAGVASAPAGLSRALRAVLARGLSAEPTERFPSMEALLSALQQGAQPQRSWRWVAAALVVLCGVAGGLLWRSWQQAPSSRALSRGEGVVRNAPNGRSLGVAHPRPSQPKGQPANRREKRSVSTIVRRAKLPSRKGRPLQKRVAHSRRGPLRRRARPTPRGRRQGVAVVARIRAVPRRRVVRGAIAPRRLAAVVAVRAVTTQRKPPLSRTASRRLAAPRFRPANPTRGRPPARVVCRDDGSSAGLTLCTQSLRISQEHLRMVSEIQRGQLLAAKQTFHRLQRIYNKEKQHLAPKHSYHLLYAKALHNRGMLGLHFREVWEARHYLAMSLRRQEKIFGAGHLALATTLLASALGEASAKKHKKALALVKRARGAFLQAFGKGHFAFGQVLQAEAFLAFQAEKFKRARVLQRQAKVHLARVLGQAHPYVGIATHNLGLLHVKNGVVKAADGALSAALSLFAKRLPKGHFAHGVAQYNLARTWVLTTKKPASKARKLLRQASSNLHQAMGMTRSFTRKAWVLLRVTAPSGRPRALMQAMRRGLSQRMRRDLEKKVRMLWLHQPLLLR